MAQARTVFHILNGYMTKDYISTNILSSILPLNSPNDLFLALYEKSATALNEA